VQVARSGVETDEADEDRETSVGCGDGDRVTAVYCKDGDRATSTGSGDSVTGARHLHDPASFVVTEARRL
jgi:hypothetical protein